MREDFETAAGIALSKLIPLEDVYNIRLVTLKYAKLLHKAPSDEANKWREKWNKLMPQILIELLNRMEDKLHDTNK